MPRLDDDSLARQFVSKGIEQALQLIHHRQCWGYNILLLRKSSFTGIPKMELNIDGDRSTLRNEVLIRTALTLSELGYGVSKAQSLSSGQIAYVIFWDVDESQIFPPIRWWRAFLKMINPKFSRSENKS